MPRFLRELSYDPRFIRTVRALGLRGPGREIYHRLVSSHEGTLRVECAGESAVFRTRTPEELRAVEATSREENLELLARFLRRGDVVYDVGSNLGVYALLLAKVVGASGMVIAFEPHRQTYEGLLEDIRLNGLGNVRAFQKALGERASQEKLYVGNVVANFSLLRKGVVAPKGTEVPFELADVVQGDRFRESQGLAVPRVVKIDVEGYEYGVIKGLRRTLSASDCRMVCCEIHPAFLPEGTSFAEIVALLNSLGYGQVEAQPRGEPFPLVARKA